MTADDGGQVVARGQDDEIRDQLAAVLPQSLGPVGLRRPAVPALHVDGSVTGYGVALLDALLPTVRAIAADELRAMAEVFDADSRHLVNGEPYAYAAGDLRDRADELDPR